MIDWFSFEDQAITRQGQAIERDQAMSYHTLWNWEWKGINNVAWWDGATGGGSGQKCLRP